MVIEPKDMAESAVEDLLPLTFVHQGSLVSSANLDIGYSQSLSGK